MILKTYKNIQSILFYCCILIIYHSNNSNAEFNEKSAHFSKEEIYINDVESEVQKYISYNLRDQYWFKILKTYRYNSIENTEYFYDAFYVKHLDSIVISNTKFLYFIDGNNLEIRDNIPIDAPNHWNNRALGQITFSDNKQSLVIGSKVFDLKSKTNVFTIKYKNLIKKYKAYPEALDIYKNDNICLIHLHSWHSVDLDILAVFNMINGKVLWKMDIGDNFIAARFINNKTILIIQSGSMQKIDIKSGNTIAFEVEMQFKKKIPGRFQVEIPNENIAFIRGMERLFKVDLISNSVVYISDFKIKSLTYDTQDIFYDTVFYESDEVSGVTCACGKHKLIMGKLIIEHTKNNSSITEVYHSQIYDKIIKGANSTIFYGVKYNEISILKLMNPEHNMKNK